MESTTTSLITIPDYSKLVPQFKNLGTFNSMWRVTMYVSATNDAVGFLVTGFPPWKSRSASGTKISVEILDQSGEHTVFDEEETIYNDKLIVSIQVRSKELEASSCVRNDSLTLRCTMSLLTTSLSEPKPKVVLVGSHTLTIDSFCKHNVALDSLECVRSTRFSVGGSTWYIKLYPKDAMWPMLSLTRASSDEPAVTVEFNFELLAGHDGHKYHESTKVTHMFNRASPRHIQLVPGTLMAKFDRFIVRCHLIVINTEMPTLRSESVLTPLSRRSSCLATIKAGIKLTMDGFSKHKAVIKAKLSMPRSESLLTPLLGCHDVRSAPC